MCATVSTGYNNTSAATGGGTADATAVLYNIFFVATFDDDDNEPRIRFER